MTVAGQTITDERLSDEAMADMLATAERDAEDGVNAAVFPSEHVRLALTELQHRREAEAAYVSVREMKLSPRPDGSTADFFVSIKVGDREVTPHVFRERFKAEYHVALYDWLLNGGDEPELMAFREDEWPARKLGPDLAASPSSPASGVRVNEHVQFRLKWRAAARPPVHLEPMEGVQTFDTLAASARFMSRQAADAEVISLTEIRSHSTDATASLLSAIGEHP